MDDDYDYYPCGRARSLPPARRTPLCKIPRSASPGLEDESFLGRKDHLYYNSRCGKCSWSQRYDDKFWNHRYGAPVYTTRFDAPSPVKPPWCPPSCKTRSFLYPRYYKKNRDGLYADECKTKPTYQVKNPTGTNATGAGCEYCRKWSIPLCPCPLAGRSRSFPSPKCCGCAPSPACVPKKLKVSPSHIPPDHEFSCEIQTINEPPVSNKTAPMKCCNNLTSPNEDPHEQIDCNQAEESRCQPVQSINVVAVIDEHSWDQIRNLLGSRTTAAGRSCGNQQAFTSRDCAKRTESQMNSSSSPQHVQEDMYNSNDYYKNNQPEFSVSWGNWNCTWNGTNTCATTRGNPGTKIGENHFNQDDTNIWTQSCLTDDQLLGTGNTTNACQHNSYLGDSKNEPQWKNVGTRENDRLEIINKYLTRSCIIRRNERGMPLPKNRGTSSMNDCRLALQEDSNFSRGRDPWK